MVREVWQTGFRAIARVKLDGSMLPVKQWVVEGGLTRGSPNIMGTYVDQIKLKHKISTWSWIDTQWCSFYGYGAQGEGDAINCFYHYQIGSTSC